MHDRFRALGFASAVAVASSAVAQDFAVETVVFAGKGADREVVARGMTLSHAGRVYDYIDATGEVLVYERAERRFQILDPARGVRTEATRAEIARHLDKVRAESVREAARLRSEGDPVSARVADDLDFDPSDAKAEFADGADLFVLAAGPARYTVRFAAATDDRQRAVAGAYAAFADEVADLGAVLHPRPLPPTVRRRVNEVLRDRGALPTAVTLEADLGTTVVMHAEHVFTLSLSEVHRSAIYQWDALLDGEMLKPVALRAYVKISHDADERG